MKNEIMMSPTAPMAGQTMPQKLYGMLRLLDRIPHDLIALISRLSISAVFWQSGQTKVDGWHVTDNAVYLFETEYKLPFIDPWIEPLAIV